MSSENQAQEKPTWQGIFRQRHIRWCYHLMGQLCKNSKSSVEFQAGAESVFPTSYFCFWLSNSHSSPAPSHFPVSNHVRSGVIPPAFRHGPKAYVLHLPVESMLNPQHYFQGLKDSSMMNSGCLLLFRQAWVQFSGWGRLTTACNPHGYLHIQCTHSETSRHK